MTEAAAPPPRLEAIGLSKRFGSFVALDDVSLTVEPGTVHALLGENGAGKSTLVKSIMGFHRPDSGEVLLGGKPLRSRSPREAQSAGIGMVYQHFTLVPAMTVAENLILARAQLPFFVDFNKEQRALSAFFQQIPFKLPIDAPVSSLSAGQKQKLEIAKQLYLGSRIVILDEPTSVLTPTEADDVLGLLSGFAGQGQISILMITHKFREVERFADEVTVLRRGRVVGRGATNKLTPAMMAEMMVGKRAAETATTPTARASTVGQRRLRVDNLHADDDRGHPALRGLSFEVKAGEIVGIAAVAGNGQEALVEILAGQRSHTSGQISVHEEPYKPTRDQIRRHKVRCLPEEPLRNACVASMSVVENIALRDFDRPPLAKGGFLSKRRLTTTGRALIAAFGVRTPSPETPIGRLSGGNVQRAVLARELRDDVDLLIVANPCMGLDFEAVAEIHNRLRRARESGTAILLVSADLDELFALADRLLVLSQGRLVHETTVESADLGRVGACMAGHI